MIEDLPMVLETYDIDSKAVSFDNAVAEIRETPFDCIDLRGSVQSSGVPKKFGYWTMTQAVLSEMAAHIPSGFDPVPFSSASIRETSRFLL
jgi:hypothetical protein